MLLFDTNVLLAAHRSAHPHHDVAIGALSEALQGAADVTVPVEVWLSVLRLATDRRVFTDPSTVDEVVAFADSLAVQHRYVQTFPAPDHLATVLSVCRDAGATGRLVPDASIAAHARALGAEVVTFDRDFARFEGVASRILRLG